MSDDPFGFDTRQLHAGQRPDSATGARATPFINPHPLFLSLRKTQ